MPLLAGVWLLSYALCSQQTPRLQNSISDLLLRGCVSYPAAHEAAMMRADWVDVEYHQMARVQVPGKFDLAFSSHQMFRIFLWSRFL